MSRFNTSTNHPIIPNAQEYVIEKKYVSIHSEDRDIIKYNNSNEFEIELPQDYVNVSAVKLSTWSFPANYNTFSNASANIYMTFTFDNIYNPGENGYSNLLQEKIFEYIYNYMNPYGTNDFVVTISEGFYDPQQMATELTNRFNYTVTSYLTTQLIEYDNNNNTNLNAMFTASGGYSDFVIVYNQVVQNIWIGNRSSTFTLTSQTQIINKFLNPIKCSTNKNNVPDFSSWGLPANLGLSRCNITSVVPENIYETRFFYGSVRPNDNGFWLLPNPDLPGAKTSYINAPYKLNNMGPSYFYIEIAGLNCLDETQPFSISSYTQTSNNTNGIVNSAFAKIGVTTTPLAQWYDYGIDSYKYFNPPAERIRKLKVRLRYHDNTLVNFNTFNYTFTLEFTLLTPQSKRTMSMTTSMFT